MIKTSGTKLESELKLVTQRAMNAESAVASLKPNINLWLRLNNWKLRLYGRGEEADA